MFDKPKQIRTRLLHRPSDVGVHSALFELRQQRVARDAEIPMNDLLLVDAANLVEASDTPFSACRLVGQIIGPLTIQASWPRVGCAHDRDANG